MTQCKEGSQRAGLMLDSSEELYKWFTQQVMTNLHVVLTMNPSSEGLKNRAATSPALFNRCVVNWFGDWSTGALYQVGQSFTTKIDLERSTVCQFYVLQSFNEFKSSDETFNLFIANKYKKCLDVHYQKKLYTEVKLSRGEYCQDIVVKKLKFC